MPANLAELLDLLTLEALDDRLFRGLQPKKSLMPRMFGGQVAAQALVAAQHTVPDDRRVHSLHSYFILGGDPSIPTLYDVEDVRDGGSFTTRRVAARQHGAIIFYMTASFHRLEEGFDHQDPMPDVLPADECPSIVDLLSEHDPGAGDFWRQEWAAADVRRAPCDDPSRQRMWFRLNGELEDNRTMRTALLTYYSDLTLLGPTLRPHGIRVGAPEVQVASLDHTIWFHRSAHANQWFLYDQHSPSASHGRGLALASVFAESGDLVASIAQEGLIRPAKP